MYRNYVVAVAMVAYLAITGTTFSSFGLYVLPVSHEFNLSRTDVNNAFILFNLGGALGAPFLGWALDRYSPRRIMLISAVVFGASFAALSLSKSLWLSGIIIALPLGIAFHGAGGATMTVFLTRWFQEARGRALALALTGMSLGNIVGPPVTAWLVEGFGWRQALIYSGVVVGSVLALLSLTMRDRPPASVPLGGEMPRETSSSSPEDGPAPVGDILRRPAFWMIALSVAVTLATSQVAFISLVPIAQEGGLTAMKAATLISAAGIAGIGGKLLLMVVDQRERRVWILITLFLLTGALDAMLMLGGASYAALMACAVVLGAVVGPVLPVSLALLADRLGAASVGTAQGLVQLILSLLILASVRIAGEVFDRMGSYHALFVAFVFIQLGAAALMYGMRFDSRESRTRAANAGRCPHRVRGQS
jgi:predicted MFS family arabinose efflux permease